MSIKMRISLMHSAALAFCTATAAQAQDQADIGQQEDIVVTATRREETLQTVPLAISAYSQEQLTRQNARTIDDIARITPGLNFARSGYGTNRADPPTIRGIGSALGSGTTGVYLDDTPINSIESANIASPPFPRVFDLERVEVLKGPQGTLFGAGSMGGALRFITPQPSLTTSRLRATTDLSTTAGDESYEAGVALGAPIVNDVLGFNISAFYRRDAGFIDHRDYFTRDLDHPNANWTRAVVVNAAVKWQATEDVSFQPSLFYQNEYGNDVNQFWLNYSDRSEGRFEQMSALRSPSKDRFFVPALKVDWDLGPARLISNTSYLTRKVDAITDYTQETNAIFFDQAEPLFAGEAIPAIYKNRQKVFTQELRLLSDSDDSPLTWVLGAFYSKLKQQDYQLVTGGESTATLMEMSGTDWYFDVPLLDAFGVSGITYGVADRPTRTLKAVYGQADYEIVEGLKATVGLRYSSTKTTFNAFTGGPINGGSATNVGENKENSLTPKFGVSYQIDPKNLLYVNASKGFRPGGAQPPVPFSFCGEDLANLGLSSSPTSYKADSLWSYEAGSKNELFGGVLRVDASAYLIRWKDIQRSIGLPICTLSYIGNLGRVESKGFEVALSASPTRNLSLYLNVGFNDADSLDTLVTAPRADGTRGTIVRAGQGLGNRRWTLAAGAEQQFDLAGHASSLSVNAEYQGPETSPLDSTLTGFNALTAVNERGYTVVRVRGSIDFGDIEVSPYIDNLFNVHPILTRGNYSSSSPLIYVTTQRPRTVGVRVTLRR